MYRMSTIILLTVAPVLEKRLHSVVVGSVGFGLVGALWCVFCEHVVGVSVCRCVSVCVLFSAPLGVFVRNRPFVCVWCMFLSWRS